MRGCVFCGVFCVRNMYVIPIYLLSRDKGWGEFDHDERSKQGNSWRVWIRGRLPLHLIDRKEEWVGTYLSLAKHRKLPKIKLMKRERDASQAISQYTFRKKSAIARQSSFLVIYHHTTTCLRGIMIARNGGPEHDTQSLTVYSFFWSFVSVNYTTIAVSPICIIPI